MVFPQPREDRLTQCRLSALRSYIGIKEKTGKNDGPEVGRFLASTKLPEGHPWCGSCQHCAYRDCDTILKPEMLFARAAHWTASNVIWNGWPEEPTMLRPGDMVTIWYDHLNRPGHVFCIDSIDARDIWRVKSLEGNTNAGGSREGTTFSSRWRSLKGCYRGSRIR